MRNRKIAHNERLLDHHLKCFKLFISVRVISAEKTSLESLLCTALHLYAWIFYSFTLVCCLSLYCTMSESAVIFS